MKFVAFSGLLSLMIISGCAGVEEMEKQIKQLRADLYSVRSDLYSEIRTQTGSLKDNLKKDMKDLDGERKRDLDTLKSGMTKEIDQLKKETDYLKDGQKRYTTETDKALLDYQKQIFQNKAMTDDMLKKGSLLESRMDDVSKKVSLLESRMTSKPATPTEGYVTFINDNIISISLGNADGAKVGDYFGVYKETNEIGVIQLQAIEANSSKGAVVNQEKPISIGDRVKPKKEH